MIRYRIPVIGGWLYRRDMRRLGRSMAEAFQRGLDEKWPQAKQAIIGDPAAFKGFDGLLAALGDQRTEPEEP